jgi:hypothetical protein
MGIHAIEAFAPNVAIDAAQPWLERALASAGREVRTRRPFPLAGGPAWREGALHWEVVELFERGTVLRVHDVGAPHWDLRFLRALSAVSDGFVEGLEHHRNREHYGAATMFAGRTVELAEYDAGTGLRGIGLPAHYEFLGRTLFEDNHQRRFTRMCDIMMTDALSDGRVVAAGEWDVSPAVEPFSPADETPASRVVLGWVDEPAFRDELPRLGAAGWRWRPLHTPKLGTPCIALVRAGALDRDQATRWARLLAAPFVAFEVPGAGRAMPFAQGYDDGKEVSLGDAVGTDPLCDQLIQLSGMFSEGVGMLFGGGNDGWYDVPGA